MIWDGWRQYEKRKILAMMVDINARLSKLETWQHGKDIKSEEVVVKTCNQEDMEKEEKNNEQDITSVATMMVEEKEDATL